MCTWNDEKVNQKNDNRIKILGSCEWFLKFRKGLPCLRPQMPQWPTMPPKEPHPLLQKNLERIRYNLCLRPDQEQEFIKQNNAY